MNNNYPQPGMGQQYQAQPQNGTAINRVEIEGYVKPRSANPQDPIRFFSFPNGGGAIHVTVEVHEPAGTDQSGQQRFSTQYIPVNIVSSRRINQQLIQSIVPGTKVHIVGKLRYKSYTSKKTGQNTGALEVNADECSILAAPQQPMQGGYQQPMQGGYQQPMGGYQQPMQQPAYGGQPQQGGYQQPMPGAYPQPAYGGQPQQPVQPRTQYVPGQNGTPQPAQGSPVPPYYQPPQGPQADNDDMPPGDPMPPVKPINI